MSCIDLIGKKFGKWTVISRAENSKSGQPMWVCKCDCGTVSKVFGNLLKGGHSKCCGCENKRNLKHGLYKARLYRIWHKMIERCEWATGENKDNYQNRGITVCEEWRKNFVSFAEWALKNGYTDELSIDRIDVNGNYEPSNCRWATSKEQANNTRRNVHISYDGKTLTLSQWAKELNINYSCLYTRLHKMGWGVKKSFTEPINYDHSQGRKII
jgi:hypothetical protein